jgi:hypothetical protein
MCPFDYTLIHRAWCLPATKAHVLTNGRRFAEPQFTSQFAETRRQAIWAVPLYADTAARHDYIVQAAGAFAETVHGLYELGNGSIVLKSAVSSMLRRWTDFRRWQSSSIEICHL